MFSYRHAFHAGNHADVLKHLILVQLCTYMRRKEKGFSYVDTHAGAGVYALDQGYAAKSGEAGSGILRLWDAPRAGMPPLVADYLDAIASLNPDGQPRFYPGSPYLVWQLLREQDAMRLFELHPTEIDILRENFASAPRRIVIGQTDGFDGLRAALPPPTRRGVTLIDPSYEDKNDYRRTVQAVVEGLKRFATGTIAVWYPLVTRAEARRLPAELEAIQPDGWLHASLAISAPPSGQGLYGSAMFVINPPYFLGDTLRATLPYLVERLGVDGQASFSLTDRTV
ncbi:23S rRNA (adenine(2030)-N(6))-methyltransferase RlmJ [Chitinasiproducens palmae]|uniref:Ribosomal RNA large subunit methyltransferase J n=1 Tax=Chitinasiproducens palmae TaxID=1770053 RepID=A0A1H2PSH4_9BURK|nr:23S rRNA (adenine(2030)-N(6))-methyltransferase RlmJ [Chitinasiproducens palmae]SDV49966.1 23S rRNA (adenine2030-N6)-methyltransferase [Chitinasiproducens palmae]